MTLRNYVLLSSVIFAVFALVHLFRILGQWDVMINGWHAPMWVSYAGLIVGGLLSFGGLRLLRKMRMYLT